MRVELTSGQNPMPAIDAALHALEEAHHLKADTLQTLRLILEELLVNIAKHGYGGAESGRIRLELNVSANRVHIVVEDEAPPFNPFADAPAPDLESELEEREPGGLGLFLVRSLVDRADYRWTGRGNRVELEKMLGV